MKNGVGTKRHHVTQKDMDYARDSFERGMKAVEIAKIIGCCPSTITNMKTGDFRMDKYLKIVYEKQQKSAEKKAAETVQLAGQMEMNLKPETETPEMSEQTKMMRFQAHLADRIIKKLDEILTELRRMQDGGVDDEQG